MEIEEALAIETETVVTDVDSQVQPMTTTSGEEQHQKFPIDAIQETKSDEMRHESVRNFNYRKDRLMKNQEQNRRPRGHPYSALRSQLM